MIPIVVDVLGTTPKSLEKT